MKKIEIILVLSILIVTLSACKNDSLESEPIARGNVTSENEGVNITMLEETSEVNETNEVIETINDSNEELAIESSIAPNMEQLTFQLTLIEKEDGSVHAIYEITDTEGIEIQTIENEPCFTKKWYDLFSGYCCFFEDFNFDGKLDAIIRNSGADVNAYFFIYLWNEEEQQFILSNDYSNIANPELNIERKQIFSVSRDAGLPIYRLYEVKDGKITVVAKLLESFDSDGTIKNIETMVETNQVTDITELNQINKIWNGYNIEIFN